MGTTFEEYKDALYNSDHVLGAVILDRAAEDYSLTLVEFLDLVKLYDRLFPVVR